MSIQTKSPRTGRRSGLTLLELLVVMLIITLLASLFLGALSAATRLSQVTNTKSLVQKLHNAMMSRWDAYRSVRLPIMLEGRSENGAGNASSEKTKYRQDIARRKMLATRELLRMEMPDRYEDLTFEPAYLVTPTNPKKPVRPYLWNAYQRRILEAKVVASKSDPVFEDMSAKDFISKIGDKFQSAECLYMIMTIGTEDSSTSTEHYAAHDIADVDGDGMKEFIDAWGTPIEFLRWAPGHYSPMQPGYTYDFPGGPGTPGSIFHATQPRDPNSGNKVISHWKVQFETFTDTNATTASNVKTINTRLVIIDQDDPFNPMRVGPVRETYSSKWARASRWRPGDPGPEHGFILIPLIYSCGPDRTSGLHHCYSEMTDAGNINNPELDPPYSIKQSPTEDDTENKSATRHIKFSDPYNLYRNSNFDGVYRGAPRYDGYNLDNVTNHEVGTR
jgi:prepilin-type N-terminal cleavage/methylation domain-containing protein